MYLTCRPARPEDLADCFREMGDALAYDPALRARVPEAWSAWLREEILTAKIFEAHTDRGVQAVGLGAWVFVSDSFAAELARPARPYLRAQLVRRWLEGERILATREQARAAHAGDGVTLLLVSHPLFNHRLANDESQCLEAAWGAALYEMRAYRTAAMFVEVNGAKLQRSLGQCGLRLVSDWTDYWRKRDGPPPDEARPFLLGLTRAEALAQAGSHSSHLFNHAPPRFDFTARQQELLRAALPGDTDEALAPGLHVSVSAVKKRWIAIYQHVGAIAPEWLEREERNTADGLALARETRGTEKRRRLLNYLRAHPEELHFVNARCE